jgi:hypothetical protein
MLHCVQCMGWLLFAAPTGRMDGILRSIHTEMAKPTGSAGTLKSFLKAVFA